MEEGYQTLGVECSPFQYAAVFWPRCLLSHKKPHVRLAGISGKRFLSELAQENPKLYGDALVQSLLARPPTPF